MSTHAIFTFIDDNGSFHVYKHWDGYPTEAIKDIRRAMKFAWDLPRFEADDFAAAFVAANKKVGGGDIRLIHNTNGDWAYHYYVRLCEPDRFYPAMLHIEAYDRGCSALIGTGGAILVREFWLESETATA